MLLRNTQNNKDCWLPDIGEKVKVWLAPQGDDGLVLGAVYSDVDKPSSASRDKRRVDFFDGTFVEYDRKANAMAIGGAIKMLDITTQASVVISTQTATVKASTSMTLDTPDTIAIGNLVVEKKLPRLAVYPPAGAATISGDVITTGDITSTSRSPWKATVTVTGMTATRPPPPSNNPPALAAGGF